MTATTLVDRWATRVVGRPAMVVLAVLLVTAFAVSHLIDWRSGKIQLQIDPAIQNLLPVDNSERQILDRAELLFGRTEAIVAAVYVDDIFQPARLRALEDATQKIEALVGVDSVLSLATAPLMSADGDDMNMATAAQAQQTPRALADAVAANPLYAGTLLSTAGDATALVIYLKEDYESGDGAAALIRGVRTTVETELPDARVRLAGPPILKDATGEALSRELTRIVPAIFILLAVFLFVGFRSVRAVLLPLLTLLIALVWVLGLIAASGRSLNLITAIVPPVVITIGLAYTLHLLSAFYRAHAQDNESGVEVALADVTLPLLMTGATTAAGFVALTLSPLTAIREFAWLSAAGVVFSVILSISFLPAMLALVGCQKLSAPPGVQVFRRAALWLGTFDVRYRRQILIAGGVVLVIAVYGSFGIQAGTDYVRGFAADAPVRMDFERISKDFGGATSLSIVLRSGENNSFAEPANLEAVQALQRWLQEQPEIGSSTSVVDYIKLLNRALHGGEQGYYAIPDNAVAVKQMLLFGSGDALQSLADTNLQNLQVKVRATISGSREIAGLIERIEHRVAKLPPPIQGQVTGTAVLVSSAVDEIADGQLLTIGAALLVVFLLLSALFTSFRVGLLAMLPNMIPIFLYFGALGFSGIPLGPTTSLIACIVLGIAVDDTLYYFARFNADAQRLASERQATISALRTIIRPVTYSSAALVLGFLVLTASGLQNQVQFGALAAFTIAAAWLADITFTPALASGVRIVTLWDVLRLDLGQEPQKSIPLFDGLSLRQARVFALLSNMQYCKAGERILSEGDKAGDLYVIIDGELRAWVRREGEDVELSNMRRGVVMGEVGHFAKTRTANVDAITDGRLLRFDNDDLERLRRRSPRIAALVFRNLNRIQAQRLAQTTQMLRHA